MSVGCYDVLMSMNLSNIAIFSISGANYGCINSISKGVAVNLLQNADLSKKIEAL